MVLGVNENGKKEVITIEINENEPSKYWMNVLNSLKNRGIRDILLLCSDDLTGIKEAIPAAFPITEQQRCIALRCATHLNTLQAKYEAVCS